MRIVDAGTVSFSKVNMSADPYTAEPPKDEKENESLDMLLTRTKLMAWSLTEKITRRPRLIGTHYQIRTVKYQKQYPPPVIYAITDEYTAQGWEVELKEPTPEQIASARHPENYHYHYEYRKKLPEIK